MVRVLKTQTVQSIGYILVKPRKSSVSAMQNPLQTLRKSRFAKKWLNEKVTATMYQYG